MITPVPHLYVRSRHYAHQHPDCAAAVLLKWLGRRRERATLARDYVSAIALDREIDRIANAHPNVWAAMWVCHGQNLTRRLRGLEQLHV